MHFGFEQLALLWPASFLGKAILFTLAGIGGPILFILARRAWRRRYFKVREQRTFELRQHWDSVLTGRMPAKKWRFDPVDRDIVETNLLDRMDAAPPEELGRLMGVLRSTGLLDTRIWEARNLSGQSRQSALVSLGRMRAPEGVPALAEALDDPDPDIRVAAVRGLGRTGLPAAAEQILRRIVQGGSRFPPTPLQNALLMTCASFPGLLLRYTRSADDNVRPLLARVLGELATPELDEELLLLASDPLPEVRASAARALGQAKPKLAMTALANLAADEAWFVRLRAVVAMGELRDSRAIPVLIETLCDPNRHVRLRSAAALARFEDHLTKIIEQVIRTRDRYAFQAFVSELERSGRMMGLVRDLLDPKRQGPVQTAITALIQEGAHHLLLDVLVRDSDWRLRVAVARLLAASGDKRLVQPLEILRASLPSPREQRVIRWILRQLGDSTAATPQDDRVPA